MLKPLETEFKGRAISLECTHKKKFPPPQMYGHTPEDVDTLWRQGAIDQNQYQHLKVWKEQCGLMVMGPKCLDCPLALKRNPRPGRPNVIETENWLEAKNKMHWDDMKAGKLTQPAAETPEPTLAKGNTGTTSVELDEEDAPEFDEADAPELDEEDAPDPEDEPAVHSPPSKKEVADKMVENGILDEPTTEPPEDGKKVPLDEQADSPGLGDDVLDALAED